MYFSERKFGRGLRFARNAGDAQVWRDIITTFSYFHCSVNTGWKPHAHIQGSILNRNSWNAQPPFEPLGKCPPPPSKHEHL